MQSPGKLPISQDDLDFVAGLRAQIFTLQQMLARKEADLQRRVLIGSPVASGSRGVAVRKEVRLVLEVR